MMGAFLPLAMGAQMGAGMGPMPGVRGGGPAYTQAGQLVADAYDDAFDNPALQCRASILWGMVHHALPNEFVQIDENRLRWTYGYMDVVRTIHLNAEHPAGIEPRFNGHSVAHWEDDTLVIDTIGFRRDLLFHPGARVNSASLHIVERVTHDPDADTLRVSWIAEDPEFWEEPMEGVVELVRSPAPYEPYDCVELAGENNRREDGSTLFD